MKKILLISIITLLLLGANLFAERYTLDQLIEIGLSKSYDIQKAKVNDQNSVSSFRSSLYGLLPSVNLGIDKGRSYSTVFVDSLGNHITYDTDWIESGSISISKAFSLNEPSYYNIRNSIYSMDNSNLSFEDTRKKIAFFIFSSYLNVLKAQETLAIQQKNLELQHKIHQQIQVQFDAGDKSLLELKQSQVSLIDYEIAVNEASNNLAKTRRDLFSYLNSKDSGNEFLEPDIDVALKEEKFTDNNALKQKLNNLKINKLNHFRTIMDFLPTLSIGYTAAHSDIDDAYAFSDYYRSSNTLSLSASWNIFNLLDNYESYTQSKRNLKLQKLDLNISERNYEIQLENLQKDLQTSSRSYELYTEKLTLAEENLKMAQEQFKLGMISLLDLDRSKIDFQNAQLSHINSHYNLMKKHEEINLLLSKPILGKW